MSREQQLFDALEGALTLIDMNKAPDWFVISARAAMSAAPPVPASVQEIMRLVMPYVMTCVKFNITPEWDIATAAAAVKSAHQPLEAALTALIEKNHELQFSLAGMNAMRRPLTEEQIKGAWNEVATGQNGNNLAGGTNLTGWTNAIRWAEIRHGIGAKNLSDEEVDKLITDTADPDAFGTMSQRLHRLARAIEKAHGIEPEQGGNHG